MFRQLSHSTRRPHRLLTASINEQGTLRNFRTKERLQAPCTTATPPSTAPPPPPQEVEVQLPPNKLWLLDKGPSLTASLSREEGIFALKQMIFAREIESEILKLYQKKLIRGYCHLYNGQEAISSGTIKAMREEDRVITAYRCHTWLIGLGTPPIDMVAELLQKETGASYGRGGSMHMFNAKLFGGNGIVGSHVPMGTGVGLSFKLRNEKRVIITVYGDGAANQGQVFECMNLAALHKLPVLYVVENNRFGMATSTARSSATNEYFRRIDFIPGVWVDGMNYLSVREAIKFGLKYVLEHGPLIIEAYTYRYLGHSVSDPGYAYRTREEIDEIRDKTDPITTFADTLMKINYLTADEKKTYQAEGRAAAKDVCEKAQQAKMPPLEDIASHVMSKPLVPAMRGTTPFTWYETKTDHSRLIKSLD